MATKERVEALARTTALLKDAADNLRMAQELMLTVQKSGRYSKILSAIHERVETESIICSKWFNNEAYDLVAERRP